MSTIRPRPYVTTRTHEVFATAHDLADRLGHDEVTAVHIALGLINDRRNIAAQILYGRGVPLDVLEPELEARLPRPGAPRVPPPTHPWTNSDENVLEQASVAGRELGAEYIGCEHLLLGFLRDPATAPAQVLAQHGVFFEDALAEVLRAYNRRPDGWMPSDSSPPSMEH
jgi:ATP-dependent Clp protease ATP-binding subunit ClpC